MGSGGDNDGVFTRQKRGRARNITGPADALAFAIATGFGSGLAPFGPGTFGSLVGLLIAYVLIDWLKSDPVALQNSLLLASLATAAAGIWASSRAERIFEQKDSGQIVIDEVCGQIISFVLIAPHLAASGERWRWWTVAGFVLFRLFDIVKPYPIRGLQDLAGGLGVMMDDIIAGIYAAIVLSLAIWPLL